MASSTRERRRIHLSLIKPVLFGGVERRVAVMSASAAIGIPLFAGLHVVTLAIALVFAFPTHALGVWMPRRDPQIDRDLRAKHLGRGPLRDVTDVGIFMQVPTFVYTTRAPVTSASIRAMSFSVAGMSAAISTSGRGDVYR